MKKLIILLMPVALLIAQKKTTPPKPAPSSQAEAPRIPDGAKQVEPYLFSYTDPQGKKWLYRQTPFGVVKWEDKPASNAPVVDNTPAPVITDLGDSVRFQYKTPFGEQKLVRKKSELTDDEKALIQRDQEKRAAPDAKPADPAKKNPEKQ